MKIVRTIIEKEALELQNSKERDAAFAYLFKMLLLYLHEGWTQRQISDTGLRAFFIKLSRSSERLSRSQETKPFTMVDKKVILILIKQQNLCGKLWLISTEKLSMQVLTQLAELLGLEIRSTGLTNWLHE